MQKINITAISYLNTKPFVYGLLQSDYIKNNCNLNFASPAECADKIFKGTTDVGLIPVAALKNFKNYRVLSKYCIGAVGKVDSVSLFSDVPMSKIQKIVLDYQSRTSVELVQILAKNYWKISPEFISGNPGFEEKIGGGVSGVVIGDRALLMKKRFRYNYDLAEEWFRFTGLPFVFALWVSARELPEIFEKEFSKAVKFGVSHINEMVIKQKDSIIPIPEMLHYLNVNMSYDFNIQKKQGLNLFLKYISSPS